MEKIDLKDRKILYELDHNSRQSLTQIGKKVGLKKDVVSYRIKRLQEIGVIECFWTDINTFKLGYNVLRVYINFQYIYADIREEIIDFFTNSKNAWVIATIEGEVDFVVILWVKDMYEFYKFWDDALDKFEDYFAKTTLSVYIQCNEYKKSYLLPDLKESNRELYKLTCGGQPVNIDDVDYKLLNEIALNARLPLIEIADKLNCSSQAVNYRIKNLMKKEVIRAFRLAINYPKIDLKSFKLDIYLKEHKKRKEIIKYLEKKPSFVCLNVAFGWCDIECEFVLKNLDELSDIIREINSKFPGAIKKQVFWVIKKIHKERTLPEM
jgi:Lrp/AsnC family leucine-responsive transcriptional regulator